jgi:uroporphyrinogen-III synthase
MRAGGLERVLGDAGHAIATLTVYANDEPPIPRDGPFEVAAVLAASPSAARRLVAAMPWMAGCAFVSVGPTTTRALRELGVASVEEPGPDPADWEGALARAALGPGRA